MGGGLDQFTQPMGVLDSPVIRQTAGLKPLMHPSAYLNNCAATMDPPGRIQVPVSQPAVRELDQSLELFIEQKWVGWLLGSGGQTMRELEEQNGVRVTMDQTTKELGYTVMKIFGSGPAVQRAHQRVQASLALVSPHGTGPPHLSGDAHAPFKEPEGDMQIDQRWVGWLLGRSGVVLKEIELLSGAKVSIDQSTRKLGYSTVRIRGGSQQNPTAHQLIQEKLAQANTARPPV